MRLRRLPLVVAPKLSEGLVIWMDKVRNSTEISVLLQTVDYGVDLNQIVILVSRGLLARWKFYSVEPLLVAHDIFSALQTN